MRTDRTMKASEHKPSTEESQRPLTGRSENLKRFFRYHYAAPGSSHDILESHQRGRAQFVWVEVRGFAALHPSQLRDSGKVSGLEHSRAAKLGRAHSSRILRPLHKSQSEDGTR